MSLNRTAITIKGYLLRSLVFFGGLFMIANGIVCTIQANLGVNPWDVLHIGLSYQVGLSIGRVMQLVGLLLIAVSFVLKVRPSVGTLMNMAFLGLFVDLVLHLDYILLPETIALRIIIFTAGVAQFGFGCAIYISANLGAGPRDSLMLALNRLFRFRVGMIRGMMEISAALAGYLLGGPLGLGTVIFALTVGVFLEAGFALIKHLKRAYGKDPLHEKSIDKKFITAGADSNET